MGQAMSPQARKIRRPSGALPHVGTPRLAGNPSGAEARAKGSNVAVRRSARPRGPGGLSSGCPRRLGASDGGARGARQHLEAALEGLQDAVYRQAQLAEEKHEELRARMEPEQMAIDLAQDARRRGL